MPYWRLQIGCQQKQFGPNIQSPAQKLPSYGTPNMVCRKCFTWKRDSGRRKNMTLPMKNQHSFFCIWAVDQARVLLSESHGFKLKLLSACFVSVQLAVNGYLVQSLRQPVARMIIGRVAAKHVARNGTFLIKCFKKLISIMGLNNTWGVKISECIPGYGLFCV